MMMIKQEILDRSAVRETIRQRLSFRFSDPGVEEITPYSELCDE